MLGMVANRECTVGLGRTQRGTECLLSLAMVNSNQSCALTCIAMGELQYGFCVCVYRCHLRAREAQGRSSP